MMRSLLKAALWVSPVAASLPNCIFYEDFALLIQGQQEKGGGDRDCWAFKTDADRCFGNYQGHLVPALGAGISASCIECLTEVSEQGDDYFAFSCNCDDGTGNWQRRWLDMAWWEHYASFRLDMTDGQAHFVCEVAGQVEILNAYTDTNCDNYDPSRCMSS